MNILIVGSGAREHAIASAFHRSPQQLRLYCCGTSINPGIQQMTHQYWTGDIAEVDAIIEQAKAWQISLAIIGPELSLEKGLADALWQQAIPTIGPRKALAAIETSKGFARNLMLTYQIPGLPKYRCFSNMSGVEDFLIELGEGNFVVKANGLMGGKGVKVAGDHLHSFQEALSFCREMLANHHTLVIEEKLIGQEFSLMCFCDGENMIPMPIVQDHKRAWVDDKGPNTGGMGSYSDADHSLPFLTEKDVHQALEINHAVIAALMAETKEKYIGVLYGSFIATAAGVFVIEFNARFGDPEALNVLSILESDFVALCQAWVTGGLTAERVNFSSQATVCKYAVPEGYPEEPVKNAVIDVSAVKNKSHLYFAAVNAVDGKMVAMGSRTAAYVGIADTISQAEEISEKEVCAIEGPLFHRVDIGTDKLIKQRVDAMQRLRQP